MQTNSLCESSFVADAETAALLQPSGCRTADQNCFGNHLQFIVDTDADLVGACLATGERIFATGSDSVSKIVLRSCGCFGLISVHTFMV